MPRYARYISWAGRLLLMFAALVGHPSHADDQVALFENHIRPLLANTCVSCHGPTRQSANLRVDSREALLTGGDSGAAIVPGQASDSLLIKAIERHEEVSPMPPDEDRALRSDQIRHVVAWVQSGAFWPAEHATVQATEHWAFAPLTSPSLPPVHDSAWCVTSVDRFIRAAQETRDVRPASVADKRTLIRRVTFDLTGLPPTPSEIDAFLRNDSPSAYAQLIDRLLASRAYGERWGRHWLDVVRYADTAGETADYPVPTASQYRDYVIESFCADRPYDQFLQEQIAGDVLAETGARNDYARRVTATGYLAISRRFGFDSENYHHLTIQDTIDTLGQSILGISLGCARCHDHKFDPISMADYYALYGIFASSRYPFPGSEQKQRVRTLAPLVAREESTVAWRKYARRVAELQTQLSAAKHPIPAAILRSLHDLDGDFELQAIASGGSNGVLVSPWLYDGHIAVTHAGQSPFQNAYAMGKVGVTVASTSKRYQIRQSLHTPATDGQSPPYYVNLDFRVESPGASQRGHHRLRLLDERKRPACELLISASTLFLRTADRVELVGEIAPDQWQNVQLTLTVDEHAVRVTYGAPGSTQQSSPFSLPDDWSGELHEVVLDNDPSAGPVATIHFDNLAIQTQPLELVTTELPQHDTDASTDVDLEQARLELERLLIDGPFAMAYGMSEGVPHDVMMQLRGEPDRPGSVVRRGFPPALGGGALPADTLGSGRQELAQWITSRNNPLTARVIANRIWQYHLGRGLVSTPNDFGLRGQPPTHPELLDHLASELIRSGWSIKALHRRILLSATYQQSSDSPSHSDGDTIRLEDLYAKCSLRRLSAEEIRDAMLLVSGLLDSSIAASHPFPSPLTWGYTQHGPYLAVYGHRYRSVYLMSQRIKRHPFLSLFDGPDPNATTAERRGTTVPTQALFFMNDPFVHEAATAWSARLPAAHESLNAWLTLAFCQAFGREPTATELSEAEAFMSQYARVSSAGHADDGGQNRQAASIAYLRALLGSNEFLHVD